MNRPFFLSCVVALLAAHTVAAQTSGQPAATGPGGEGQPAPGAIVMKQPPEKATDLTPRVVRTAPRNHDRDSADAGALKGIRLLTSKDGRARVVLSSGERTIAAGDVVGTDVVKRVEAGRIILTRPAASGEAGDAKVIVSFDGQGRGRVHVFVQKADVPRPTLTTEEN